MRLQHCHTLGSKLPIKNNTLLFVYTPVKAVLTCNGVWEQLGKTKEQKESLYANI